MAIASLLDIDLKQVIEEIERACGIALPRRIIETALIPEEGILHIRFEEPEEAELGEPIHPLIHLFRDRKTGRITAVEIVDLNKLVSMRGR